MIAEVLQRAQREGLIPSADTRFLASGLAAYSHRINLSKLRYSFADYFHADIKQFLSGAPVALHCLPYLKL